MKYIQHFVFINKSCVFVLLKLYPCISSSECVPRNNTPVYTKSHNSGFNNYSVMPPFSTWRKSRQAFAFAP